MEIEKVLALMPSFADSLDNLPYIIEMKRRLEVGNLEYNLKIIQKELERSIQKNPDDRITQYKQIWLVYNYYSKDDDSLKRIRTVNNLVIDDLPMGKELITRGQSQKSINEFYVKNGLYTIAELIEINDIESITESKAIEREKKILEKLDYSFSKNDNSNKKKHSLPLIDKEKYDPDKIYSLFFKGVIAHCNHDCFKAWFVDGYTSDTITILENGKKQTKPIAQIRKFIEVVTGDSNFTKDAYFAMVFATELNNTNTANTLNSKYRGLLKLCEK